MSVLETIGGTRLFLLEHMIPEGSARILMKLDGAPAAEARR